MIYLDNAASTRPHAEVLSVMGEAAERLFANPSSAHRLGAEGSRALETAREQVARLLAADSAEVVFTSGGTEANALGVLGAARARRGRHLVVSGLEHPAVFRSAELLVESGFRLTVVAPTAEGVVDARALLAAVEDAPDGETALVALMLVNNELGTVQPVAQVGRALQALGRRRPHFHVDAVQAVGQMPVAPQSLGADTLALSGHKIHGPKGVGALWVRRGTRLAPLWDGGRQERGLRSGTENLPAIAGLGQAATLAFEGLRGGIPEQVAGLRDQLETLVYARLPEARPTVAGAPRAPHVASIALAHRPAEPLLHALENRGVFVSAGSACAARNRTPSRTLQALGVDDRTAVLRFSLSRYTTAAEVESAAGALVEAAAEIPPLRS